MNDPSHEDDLMSDLLPPAYAANNEALSGLDMLARLAKGGDEDAIRMFHEIACSMVARLNEFHLDYASRVLEWPIVLPQAREAREAVMARAKTMRIASVKAGGKGASEKLAYESERGFAMENLRRVGLARIILQYGNEHGFLKELSEVTGIENFSTELVAAIRGLEEYSPETRTEWIGVMLILLNDNPQLVPSAIGKRAKTVSHVSMGADAKPEKVISERGGTLKKTLKDGLKNVTAMPPI